MSALHHFQAHCEVCNKLDDTEHMHSYHVENCDFDNGRASMCFCDGYVCPECDPRAES